MTRPKESLLTKRLVTYAQAQTDAFMAHGPALSAVRAALDAAREAVDELKYLRAEVKGLRQAVDYYNGVVPGRVSGRKVPRHG